MTEELGAIRNASAAARRIASAFGAVSVLIVIVWLLRGPLGITAYSFDLLLSILGFIFLSMVFRTRGRSAVRAVSNFFLNIFGFCVIAIILIWILEWIAGLQHSSFPSLLPGYIPDLVIAALVTLIASYLIGQAAPKTRFHGGRPMLVRAGSKVKLGEASLSTVEDGIALPLGQQDKPPNYVLFSNLSMSFDTPMGKKEMMLKSPVAISGIPLPASKTNEETVRKLTNSSPKELLETALMNMPESSDLGSTTTIDLPFVHVKEGGEEEVVEVGPINVRSGRFGDHVKIGPFEFKDGDEGEKTNPHWYAFSRSGGSVTSHRNRIFAKWNGSSLLLKDDFMRLKSGSDSFEYDPHEITTKSPLHKLRVTQSNVTLETAQFMINVQEGKVVVREQDGKTKSSESGGLARDLKSVLGDLAMKQVKDVIAGEPIDLGELLERTEEVLNRYE